MAKHEKEEENLKNNYTEVWQGYHGTVTAPKGTFDRIYWSAMCEDMYDSEGPRFNPDFKAFCDKAIARGEAETLEDLFEHKIVHEVAQSYMKGGCNANRGK